MANMRIPYLLEIPASVRFVSIEPMIGPIKIDEAYIDWIRWVIVGGESGADGRWMDPNWARDIKNQCIKAGDTYFFMKQMTGNTKAKREAIPEDLMIREFPNEN